MGLDVGTKTIGVSVSDELGWTAQGVEVIRRTGDQQADLRRVRELATEMDVHKIVVGLPKNMDGSIGPAGKECQRFAARLEECLDLPTQLWDERLSTRTAERLLVEADVRRKRRKSVIDKMAAVIILQNYLDAHKR
jgi:putative holliday junction resolvase